MPFPFYVQSRHSLKITYSLWIRILIQLNTKTIFSYIQGTFLPSPFLYTNRYLLFLKDHHIWLKRKTPKLTCKCIIWVTESSNQTKGLRSYIEQSNWQTTSALQPEKHCYLSEGMNASVCLWERLWCLCPRQATLGDWRELEPWWEENRKQRIFFFVLVSVFTL